MTAEITIMNKEAIVLAADSAVTFPNYTGSKIFQTANKIFTLSKYSPVGIMVYNNPNFMSVPWETIIKLYRKKLGNKNFPKLRDYANDFIKFIIKNKKVASEHVQEAYFINNASDYVLGLRDTILKVVENEIKAKKPISSKQIIDTADSIIKSMNDLWKKFERNKFIPKSQPSKFLEKYSKQIENVIDSIFERFPLAKKQKELIKKSIGDLFTKFIPGFYPDYSGIVIAGFGEEEIFPSQVSLLMVGLIEDCLNFSEDSRRSSSINYELRASITPFAQNEMVYTFMEGVNPSYNNMIENDIRKLYNKLYGIVISNIKIQNKKETKDSSEKLKKIVIKEAEEYIDNLKAYRRSNFVDPIINVLVALPKNELAIMAETLINLTCFKRKISMEEETVGGPIDVAIISKGDGFIWIKRKHYFKSDLNPGFFNNYFRE